MNEAVIKSLETKEGVCFRVLKDGKYIFLNKKFSNYFYVKTKDYLSNESEFLNKFNYCIKDAKAVGQFTKIYLSSNWMRVRVRKYWEEFANTYEADIKADKRFLLDNNITLNNTQIPYTLYDIETDDRLPLQKDERGNVIPGNARILAFAATDHEGKQVYYELNSYTDEDEYAMLTMIINYFSNYGVISGWNSEKFDMPYIKGRCDALGVKYHILEYVNHIDYMDLFKKYDKKSRKSYSLNNISNEVLHESKIDQDKGNGAIYNTWLNDKDQLRRYNLEDSNLVYKINLAMLFIEVSMKRADNAGCHVRNTMNNSDSGDFLLMREYKKSGIIMPSKPTREEVEQRKLEGKIGGGYTTCFNPGFHKDVHIWDFKSEYPSVIQTWNISPETYVETINDEKAAAAIDREQFIVTPHDFEGVYHPTRIYKKEEGVIPRVVRTIVEERDKIKYTMKQYKDTDPDKYKQQYLEQYALKTDGNSIYGILAFPMSRYYSWELGDSVTTCARATLKACNEELKKWHCTVIGGDTDSTFVKFDIPDLTIEQIDENFRIFLEGWGNKYGAKVNKLEFEYEKTFDTMLFVKKKHYAFKIGDSLTIKGMESIKSDTNVLAAKMQKEFIHDVLNEAVDEEAWRNKVEFQYNKVFNQEMTTAELSLVKALTKMPKDYEGSVIDKKTSQPKIKADGTIQEKAIPAHVKLAERLIGQGKELYPGTKIQFIVIADKPILALSPEEYEKGEGSFQHKNKKTGIYQYDWEGGYAAKYYWLRVMKPLLKVAYVYKPDMVITWELHMTQSEINKLNRDTDE